MLTFIAYTLLLLASTFILVLAVAALFYWLDRPRKRSLKNRADKINALLDITQRIITPALSYEIPGMFQQWYPQILEEEFEELWDYCQQVEQTAYNLVLQVREGTLSEADFKEKLSERYPLLSSRSLDLTLTAQYFFSM